MGEPAAHAGGSGSVLVTGRTSSGPFTVFVAGFFYLCTPPASYLVRRPGSLGGRARATPTPRTWYLRYLELICEKMGRCSALGFVAPHFR